MGKRSDFEHREADFYPTPRAALVPLIPHLGGIRAFAEPCAGEGDLVRHVGSFGLCCVYAGDIRTGFNSGIVARQPARNVARYIDRSDPTPSSAPIPVGHALIAVG